MKKLAEALALKKDTRMRNIDDRSVEKIESLTDFEQQLLVNAICDDIQKCIQGVCEEWNRDLPINLK